MKFWSVINITHVTFIQDTVSLHPEVLEMSKVSNPVFWEFRLIDVIVMCFIHRMHLQIILCMGGSSCLTIACETEKEEYISLHFSNERKFKWNEEAYRCYKRNFLGF